MGHIAPADLALGVGLLVAAGIVVARRIGTPRSGLLALALVLFALRTGWMLLPGPLLMPLLDWTAEFGMDLPTLLLLAAVGLVAFVLWRNATDTAPDGAPPQERDSLLRAAMSPDVREGDFNEISTARGRCAEAAAHLERRLQESSERFHVYAQYDAACEPWLQVDRLASDSRGRFVASLRIVFRPQPFGVVPVLADVEVDDRGRRRRYGSVIDVGAEQLDALVRCLEGQGPRFKWRATRLRQWPWQLWRPRQLSSVLETPFAASMRANVRLLLLIALGVMLLWFWATSPLLTTAFAVLGVWGWRHFVVPNPLYRVVVNCPPRPPRSLRGLDSWQAVVRDLGPQREAIVERLEAVLRERLTDNEEPVAVRREDIWYDGADGKVERQQLTVSLRRAIVFIRIYRYGADLFVGWDAHVNVNCWAEKRLETGHRASDGVKVQLIGVQARAHSINEYDITDANFLLEATHVHLVSLLRQVLREHEIDQELDFTIVRESRQALVSAAQSEGRRRMFSRA
ncbi:MAG: hypothetical protein QM702_24065 [Rubrivivax sp.]